MEVNKKFFDQVFSEPNLAISIYFLFEVELPVMSQTNDKLPVQLQWQEALPKKQQ